MTTKPAVVLMLAPLITVPLLTACGGVAAANQPEGAVQGTVTAGPTCPVERADHPCPPAPVRGADVRLARADGTTAADTATDKGGAFHLSATPGSYMLIATNPGGYHSQASRAVRLTAGHTEQVDLQLDTGIR